MRGCTLYTRGCVMIMDGAEITRSESLKSLLSLWNLQDFDDEQFKALTIRGYSQPSPSSSCIISTTMMATMTSQLMKTVQCTQCLVGNDVTNNWCVECGKCITSENVKSDSSMDNSKTVPLASVELADVSQTSSTCEEVTECSMHTDNQVKTKTRERLTNNDLNRLKMSQTVCPHNDALRINLVSPSVEDSSGVASTVMCERKWSSGFCMWRKKTSLITHPSAKPINAKLDSFSEKLESAKTKCLPLVPFEEEKEYISNQESCFFLLPNEIILIILSHLSHRDLTVCKRVCKRLHQIAFDFKIACSEAVLSGVVTGETLRKCCETLPTSLTLKKCQFDCDKLKSIKKSISTLGNSLKRLTVDTCNMGVAGNDTLLHSISVSCQNVVYIRLEWITVNGKLFLDAMESLKRIEELHLIDVSGVTFQDRKKAIIAFSQRSNCRLHTLQLKLRPGLPISNVLNRRNSLPYLKTIIFRQNFKKITGEDIQCLLSGLPSIENIEIECIEVTEDVYQILSKTSIKHNLAKKN